MTARTPQRLLEGVARTLRDDVASAVSDAYARAQLAAAAEILDNLAPRVRWDPTLDEARRDMVLPLLARAVEVAPPGGLPLARAALARPAALSAALAALAEVQAWLALPTTRQPELDERMRSFIAEDLARERALLRTGMYRSRGGQPPP